MFQIKIRKKWNRQNCVVTVFMESSGPIFLTKGNNIPYLYVLTFGWKPYFSTILLVTHLSFIIKNGKRFYFSRSDGFEPSKSKYRNLNYYPFLKFAVCFPNCRELRCRPPYPKVPAVFKTVLKAVWVNSLFSISNMSKTDLFFNTLQIYKIIFNKTNISYIFFI